MKAAIESISAAVTTPWPPRPWMRNWNMRRLSSPDGRLISVQAALTSAGNHRWSRPRPPVRLGATANEEVTTMPTTSAQPTTTPTPTGAYRAAVVHDFKSPLTVEHVAKPTLGSGEVLVKVEASGLCHTDIHAAHGDWPVKPSPPFIPGHEGVGVVAEVGPGVSEVAVGDRVTMPWLGYACGTCDYCVSGWETLCLEQKNMGYSIDGGFAEYVKAFARYVVN